MSIPVSSGIGTGEAQVYSMGKTYDALKDVGQSVALANEYKRREEAIKAKDKAENEKEKVQLNKAFRQEYGFEDYSKLHTPQIPIVRKKVDDFFSKYGTKGYEVYSGGEAALQAQKDWSDIQGLIGESMQTKDYLDKIGNDIFANSKEWSNDDIKRYNEVLERGDLPLSSFKGSFNRTVDIPDPVKTAMDGTKDLGAYLNKQTNVQNNDGTYSNQSVLWNDDKVAYPEFKQTWMNDATFLSGINNHTQMLMKENKDISFKDAQEQVLEQTYASFKNRMMPQQETNITKTTTEKDDGGGYSYDTKNWNVQLDKDENGNERTTINKKTGGNLAISNVNVKGEDGKSYQLTQGNIISYRFDKENKPIFTVSGKSLVDGKEVPFLQKEVRLPSEQWNQISNTIGAKVNIQDLTKGLKPTNVSVKKDGKTKEVNWGNK